MTGRGTKGQSPESVITLINRMAAAIAADEADLRERIVGLIDGGRMDEAKALLHAWDVMAAGDVLKEHVGIGDGHTG